MLDFTLDDPPDHLTDIVVPARGTVFPPFGSSPVLLEPSFQAAFKEEGWCFADSFELAMIAVCLAGASFLAATLLGADQITASLVPEASVRQARAIMSGLACLSILVGLVFTVEGLFRLRALTRDLDQADPLTRPSDATPGCAGEAAPGAQTGRSLARSPASARRPTSGS